MKKTLASILSLSILSIIFLPAFVSAQVGIPCYDGQCTFDDLIILVNNIIKFLMFSVAVPLAAIGFMWMGAKLVLLPNKESAMTEAKDGVMSIVKGFAIMLGAYVFIKTILYAFLTDEQAGFMNFLFQ